MVKWFAFKDKENKIAYTRYIQWSRILNRIGLWQLSKKYLIFYVMCRVGSNVVNTVSEVVSVW